MVCECTMCVGSGCKCCEYTQFFSAIGNISRLHIINALRKGDRSVGEICELTGLEQSLVSHHLSTLQKAGMVSSEKNGKSRMYSVNKQTIEPVMKIIDTHVDEVKK